MRTIKYISIVKYDTYIVINAKFDCKKVLYRPIDTALLHVNKTFDMYIAINHY